MVGQMASDKELAEGVRSAAWKLAEAMNRAGLAGLHVECTIRAYAMRTHADGRCQHYDFQPTIHVMRDVPL